jgi:hypothetical protein
MDEYITVAGFVQFDPRNREAGGKPVRDVAVRAIGNNKIINITFWPEHDMPVNKGDFLVVDGKFTQRTGQNKQGESQTYYNLSASTILRLVPDTSPSAPKPKQQENTPASTDTDDFPF